ncbi:MAG: hypothetical protein ACLULK_00600 [Anaerovoracaceae bacterium]
MRVRVKAEGINLNIPVPVFAAGAAVKMIPDSVFEKARKNIPKPFDRFVSKEYVIAVCDECKEIFRQNKGLEIIHVEAGDGTFISVKL